ncbi:MAG TPA: sugar ABC transporter permease [Clostridiales bacterium]|nr:sugar ABC transporter permease [Clostridiales bacterium]
MIKSVRKIYSYWFLVPAAAVFLIFFILPTIMSFFFSLTRWDLSSWTFIGLQNFQSFFQTYSLSIGLVNTIIYAVLTSSMKVIIGLMFGLFLCSKIKTKNFLRSVVFFPSLVSTIAVGMTFSSLMNPTHGIINGVLSLFGIAGPDWLGNPSLALYSVIFVDVWKGVGIATVIYIAGITSIPNDYNEAFAIDGGNRWQKFIYLTLPMVRPAMNTVIILSFIGGMRTFDLVWTMTQGGPGFASDLVASVIYKQYTAGYYGLSAAGNVVLLAMISLLAFPLYTFLNKSEVAE